MEVTRLNFTSLLPQILADISSATFLSFDMELSGLLANKRIKSTWADTLQQRYMKDRENTQSFYPMQVGLCTFHKFADRFQVRPYSFYLFPRSLPSYPRNFLMQSSSADFLSKHNFDFNKTFLNGINYLNSLDRFLVASKHAQEDIKTSHLMRASYLYVKDKVDALFTGEPLIIETAPIPFTIIKYIISELEREKGLKVTCEFLQNKIEFTISTSTELGKEEEDFSKVVLAMQGKPLVGHNMLIDSMHLYDKFIEPLPISHFTFRNRFAKSFPKVYDTKHIIQTNTELQRRLNASTNTSLHYCYSQLKNIESHYTLPIEFQSPVEITEHNAAYDAYCTGILFIRSAQVFDGSFNDVPNTLNSFANCMPISGRRTSLSFSTDSYTQSRDIFVVTNMPPVLSLKVLEQNLSTAFGPVALYQVYWATDTVIVCPSSSVSRNKMMQEVTHPRSFETSAGDVWLSPYDEKGDLGNEPTGN